MSDASISDDVGYPKDFVPVEWRGTIQAARRMNTPIGISFDRANGGEPIRLLLSVDGALDVADTLLMAIERYSTRTASHSASVSGSPQPDVSTPLDGEKV